jgi:hypothetical protein
LEIDKDSNPSGLLLTFSQFTENQKPFITSGDPEGLPRYGKRVEIIIGDAVSFHDANSTDPFVKEKSPREQDTATENPFLDIKVDFGLNLTGPFVEGKQVDGGKGIKSVDGDRC